MELGNNQFLCFGWFSTFMANFMLLCFLLFSRQFRSIVSSAHLYISPSLVFCPVFSEPSQLQLGWWRSSRPVQLVLTHLSLLMTPSLLYGFANNAICVWSPFQVHGELEHKVPVHTRVEEHQLSFLFIDFHGVFPGVLSSFLQLLEDFWLFKRKDMSSMERVREGLYRFRDWFKIILQVDRFRQCEVVNIFEVDDNFANDEISTIIF